jgi:hypothetical protein
MLFQLRDDIVRSLGIDGDLFTLALIEEALENIDPMDYQIFFNALHGEEHRFTKPLDRVTKVAKQFKEDRHAALTSGTTTLAKRIYNRLYTIHASLTEYADMHVKDSKLSEFFERIDYKVTKFDDETLSQQELYVLKELGGGAWLYAMKYEPNSGAVIARIEAIINTAIVKKQQQLEHIKTHQLEGGR